MLCHNCFRRTGVYHVVVKPEDRQSPRIICKTCHLEMEKELRIVDLPQILSRLIHGVWVQKVRSESSEFDDRTCPVCRYTWRDYKDSGQLGCDRCYQTFRDGIQKTITVGADVSHIQDSLIDHDNLQGIIEFKRMLTQALDGAVQKEDFEMAAIIRDKLKKLDEMALE